MKNKKVFISLTAESIHHGHIKLIDEGKKYGDIVIGLLTDNAVAQHKRLPLLNFEQRQLIASVPISLSFGFISFKISPMNLFLDAPIKSG